MQTKNIYRLTSLLVLTTLIISTNLVAHAAHSAAPVQATTNFANLAWFYKPPADGNLTLIAQNFSTFIMTKGNESTRDQLLALGAQRPVLEYMRFEAIMDPGSCTATPWNNNVAYKVGDFCDISANHPDWFLLDTSGQRIIHMTGTTKFVLMDPGNAGWRVFFLDRIKQIFAADPVWDGVFLDNVEATNSFHVNAGEALAAYPDNASFQAAVQGFLQYLRTNFFQPNGKLLSANLISRTDDADFTKYITYLDGVMHEGWAIDDPNRWRSAAEWEKHMELAERTQEMGKSIILVSHGTQTDLELQNFAYASYLLITNGKASFRYASSSAYNQAWLYDNYQLNLGVPLGKRYQNGAAWKRDFTNGSVTVDPNSHTVSINLAANPTPTILPPTATTQATQPPAATATAPLPTATATKSATPVVTNTPTKTAAPGQPASTALFLPVADTYVNAGSPTSMYGKATALRLDASPIVRTYLRFSVTGLGGKIISRAQLKIYTNTSATKGIRAVAVADNIWSELTTNYNNAPVLGGQLALSSKAVAATWITLDITPYISGEGSFNIGIVTDSTTAINLASRESGTNAPQLVLDLR